MFSIRLLEETTGGTNVTWLLWVALGFFAVMVLVGWLTSRKQKPEEPAHPEPAHGHDEHEAHH